MTSFDYLVLAIIAISTILGLLRGLIRELLSLGAYIAAFLGAIWWGPRLSVWSESFIDNGLLRTGLAYLAVFLAILLLVGLINITLSTLLQKTGLTPADHGLGGLFGGLRGLLIVMVLVTLAGYTELPEEPWWQEARLSSATVQAVLHLKAWLPPTVAEWLPY